MSAAVVGTVPLSTLEKPGLLARKRQFSGDIPPAPAAPPIGSAARDSMLMPPPTLAKRPRKTNIDEDVTEESAAERTMRQQHGSNSIGSHGGASVRSSTRAPAAPSRNPHKNRDGEFLPDGSEITSSPDISSASTTTASGAVPRLQHGVVRSHISGSEASSSGQRSAIDVLVQQALNQQVARPAGAPSAISAGAAAAAALARAPAAPAVGRGRAADPDHCPVCREQFAAQFEQLQQAQGAAVTPTSAKNNKREDKVRSHIMKTTGDRYKLIFRIESILRGMVSDEQLIPLLVELHSDLIESVLRQHPGIHFHPWSHRMLTDHFNIDNEHIFDPIREAVRDLRICRKGITVLESRYLVPDPDNPAQRIVDHRVISSMCRLSNRKEGLITKIQAYHKMKEENLAESIFALLSEISHQAADRARQVTQDVRLAAGTMLVGGDTMRSAGASLGTSVGTAHDFYAISGF